MKVNNSKKGHRLEICKTYKTYKNIKWCTLIKEQSGKINILCYAQCLSHRRPLHNCDMNAIIRGKHYFTAQSHIHPSLRLQIECKTYDKQSPHPWNQCCHHFLNIGDKSHHHTLYQSTSNIDKPQLIVYGDTYGFFATQQNYGYFRL